MIKGCVWVDSRIHIFLAIKRNYLCHFSIRYQKKYQGSYYQLLLSDEIHCPVSSSIILDMCLIKGSNSKDFGVTVN